ncbi:class II aldolase/adducin family protein [Streptomyces xinghaiensis]|uniref:Truncated FlFT4, 4-fluorothreonine biosynthesis n=1 Tax=Streptomyces xinghaiensis TaxID=1038928 RepID=A0A068VNM6_9ACTN|nr:class II aldolase/adducin family protein [Streptomyces xinghaiensis]MZE81331.1 hypothetical protein [Streptomyces sp. SID5475]CDP39160.1 truncated FlFT4, 4-fluorothreonine biosynthesis [Streptomyces xinghaiensis]
MVRVATKDGGVLVLPPQEYGSVALTEAEAVAEAAGKSRMTYVRRHGLVFWATEYEECREMVERLGGGRPAAAEEAVPSCPGPGPGRASLRSTRKQ